MKFRHIISLSAGVILAFAACSPDDYSMGDAQYTSEQLVEGSAYTVTVNGNVVTLKSLISDCTPLWVTPNGRSQEKELTIELPFAGEYEVTFGTDTRAGAVYGEPYTFTLSENDFSLLSDNKYFYLAASGFKEGDDTPSAATLSAGVSKKWYPNDKDYGLGCTGPVMYMTPYDPENDGYTDAEAAAGNYKEIVFGRDNWGPNWDPGFQSWLIPEDDPYMDSYMEFSMSASGGCSATMYRGESGSKGSSTGTTMNGKYQLALGGSCPTLTFTDCYAMHNTGFDEVCSNYTQEITVAELTPYYLCLVTKRTNSEGNWYIVWNFVSEEVKQTDGACIPQEETGLKETVAPTLPTISDLATNIFTTDINGTTFTGNQMTFLLSDEAPYDWMSWNNSASVAAWESVTNGTYNDTWAPAFTGTEDFELTFAKKSDGSYTYEFGSGESGTLTIGENTITFDQEVTILSTSSDTRTVEVKGTEFTVLKCVAGEELQIGVPASYDTEGNVNSYLVANLTYKAVGGGETGPTTVKFDADKVNNYIEAEKYFRCQIYNPWGGGGDMVDPADIKLKKNQTIKVTLTLSGFTFSQPAKMVLCCNRGSEQEWETACFDYSRAITVESDGTYTISWTNDTGSTVKWDDGSSALTMTMQYDGYATVEPDADGSYKAACTVESIIIE